MAIWVIYMTKLSWLRISVIIGSWLRMSVVIVILGLMNSHHALSVRLVCLDSTMTFFLAVGPSSRNYLVCIIPLIFINLNFMYYFCFSLFLSLIITCVNFLDLLT